jgi:hypothetical protein
VGCSLQFLLARSKAVKIRDRHRDRHPCEWAPRGTRGKMRPSLKRNSPPLWDELSLWHAIEMHPAVAELPSCVYPRPAPTLICHSVAWQRPPRTVIHAPHREMVEASSTTQRIVGTGHAVRCDLRYRWAATLVRSISSSHLNRWQRLVQRGADVKNWPYR